MGDSKYSGTGADWTQLLTDPSLVSHLGELLQVYREAAPEKRDQALLDAMRNIRSSNVPKGSAASKAPSAKTLEPPAPAVRPSPAPPVATSPAASPPFEPDIFAPTSSQDRRRHTRMKCFVAVELRLGNSTVPVWGNLANTGLGGCFVETATPVPSGVPVEIGLWLANGKIWIKGLILTGIVTKSSPSFGVRIKFSELEPTERENLRHFLKFVESTTKGYNTENGYLAQLKR
jgi:PilZ domain-containing protein